MEVSVLLEKKLARGTEQKPLQMTLLSFPTIKRHCVVHRRRYSSKTHLWNPEFRPFRKPSLYRRLQGLATGETPRTANHTFQTQNLARAPISEHISTTWASRRPHRHSQL